MATNTELVQQLYVAYYNRPADVGGLAFWVGKLDAGVSIDAVSKAFNTAPEYTSLYAGKTPDQVVDTVYMNLFGRHAEQGGLNFWGPKVADGSISTADLVKFIGAGAVDADGNPNADGVALANKATAAAAFTTELSQVGNEAERLGYESDNSVGRVYVASVTDDASLATAIANVHTTALGTIPVPASVTHTMTTGVDSGAAFTGGIGIDTFNAAAGTFNVGDAIIGGAGADTLNWIESADILGTPVGSTVSGIETVNVINATTKAITLDTTSWSGLTALNTTTAGGAQTLTAAGTTAVTATETAQAATAINVQGGSNVQVTTTGATSGTITVGGTTAPTGTVTINETASIAGGAAAGAISVTGGTTVSVTEVGSSSTVAVPGTATTATQSAVNVTGTSTTTAVTVSQSAAVAAVAGTAGVAQVDTLTIGGTPGTGDILTATINGVVYSVTLTAGQAASVTTAAQALASAITASGITVGTAAAGAFTLTAASAGTAFTISSGVTVVGGTATTNTDVHTTANTAIVAGTSGLADGAVTIADANASSATKAATISTVTLTNYGNSTISSNALANLSLSGTGGTVGITSGLTTETVKKLNLTVNNLSGANTITDSSNHFTTIAVTTAGKDSTIANIVDTAATALTVAGTNVLTMTAVGGMANLATVAVSGAAGLSADVSGLAAALTVDASASSGANTLTLAAGQAYKGGSGVDTVTMTAAPTVSIDGGAGTNDVFVMNAASFALTNVKNFETLGLGTLATGAYSAAGFTHLTEGAVAAAVTFNTVAAGTDLTITGNVGFGTTYTLATDTSSDTLNLKLSSSGAINAGAVTATNVETVNITTVDTNSTKHVDSMTLVDTALTTLKISGNAGLDMGTNTSTTITSIDASGITNTAGTANSGFHIVTAALAAAATIKGSATGGDVIDASAATKAVTITETAGANTITGSSTIASTLTGGTGADAINGGAGNDVIVGGGGADVITGGAGADTITVSGVTSTIVQAIGGSGVNTATNTQTSELTTTFDVIKGIAAGDKINLGSMVTGAALVTADLQLTNSVNLQGAADKVVFAHGTYDAGAGTFTYAANGLDTAVTFNDTGVAHGTTYETIILVGYSVGSTTTAAAGVITLG